MKQLLFLAASIFIIQSCSKDQAVVKECEDTISYATDVAPMINNSCNTSGCHDASNAGGYNFETYANISANAELMLSAIRHDVGPTPMPLGGNQWPDTNIQTFKCWINQGKLDN